MSRQLARPLHRLRDMGQSDLAIRLLAENHLAELLPGLYIGHHVQVLGIERTELKLVERHTDDVVRARLDGVESILHTEFQASHEAIVPVRMLAYQALLRHRHYPLPVRSLVVYLMHEPPREPIPRGIVPCIEDPQVHFSYDLFCPWERAITPEEVRAKPALAPIAALTPGVDDHNLAVLREAIESCLIETQAKGDLLAITYIIAGRRFSIDLVKSCLRSKAMEESATYREILSEGQARALRRAILGFVEAKLGTVPDGLVHQLEQMEAEALDELLARLHHAPGRTDVEAILPR